MQQVEVYHIYHLGEQRGPYSVRQVNHLYRCGYICDDTLYWREGMEQWQPVTDIVERRMQRKRLRRWGITVGVAALLAVLVFLFGPVTRDAWKELTSGEYTAESAWWRARGVVRERLEEGDHVVFEARSAAQIQLSDKNIAVVSLGGQVTDTNGKVAHGSWTIAMQFDAERRQWLPAPSENSAAPAKPAALAPATVVPDPAVAPAPTAPIDVPPPAQTQNTLPTLDPGTATASTPSRSLAPQ